MNYEEMFKYIYMDACIIKDIGVVDDRMNPELQVKDYIIDIKRKDNDRLIAREILSFDINTINIQQAKEETYKRLFLSLLRYTSILTKIQETVRPIVCFTKEDKCIT